MNDRKIAHGTAASGDDGGEEAKQGPDLKLHPPAVTLPSSSPSCCTWGTASTGALFQRFCVEEKVKERRESVGDGRLSGPVLRRPRAASVASILDR